jgi:predicted Zn finger-like uncharacterized protein
MLFTRCPSCDTTFRVSDEALAKANGQVRCGRCASVFNAYTELRDTSAQDDGVASGAVKAAAGRVEEKARVPAPSGDEPYDDLSVAAVLAQVKLGDDELPSQAETPRNHSSGRSDPGSLSAERLQQVLEEDPRASATTAIWALEDPPADRANGWWRFGALLAVLTLGLQGIHHFRAELAGQALVGTLLQQAYGMFGTSVSPHWDIEQYQILDWVAAAEPNARGQGSLQITARVHNRGPQPQPYPHIHLQLKDRWEETVGSRVFRPAEYLATAATANQLMPAGDTAQAQLQVADPGPDAYGFELDVCVEVETDVLTCGNDEVFL